MGIVEGAVNIWYIKIETPSPHLPEIAADIPSIAYFHALISIVIAFASRKPPISVENEARRTAGHRRVSRQSPANIGRKNPSMVSVPATWRLVPHGGTAKNRHASPWIWETESSVLGRKSTQTNRARSALRPGTTPSLWLEHLVRRRRTIPAQIIIRIESARLQILRLPLCARADHGGIPEPSFLTNRPPRPRSSPLNRLPFWDILR